jgi:hypothetical protein
MPFQSVGTIVNAPIALERTPPESGRYCGQRYLLQGVDAGNLINVSGGNRSSCHLAEDPLSSVVLTGKMLSFQPLKISITHSSRRLRGFTAGLVIMKQFSITYGTHLLVSILSPFPFHPFDTTKETPLLRGLP